jgi:hypothetical protein
MMLRVTRWDAGVLHGDLEEANRLVREATLRTRAVLRDARVLLSLYVPSDHLFALYAP